MLFVLHAARHRGGGAKAGVRAQRQSGVPTAELLSGWNYFISEHWVGAGGGGGAGRNQGPALRSG